MLASTIETGGDPTISTADAQTLATIYSNIVSTQEALATTQAIDPTSSDVQLLQSAISDMQTIYDSILTVAQSSYSPPPDTTTTTTTSSPPPAPTVTSTTTTSTTSTGGSTTPQDTALPPTPTPPPSTSPTISTGTSSIKTAPIDTVLLKDDSNPEMVLDIVFEDLAGQELLTIARSDTVNGLNVLYQPIKNLNLLAVDFNPFTLIKNYQTADTIFANFTINILSKIPFVGNGPNGSNVYLDSDGSLIVEFVNLSQEEQVEVQVLSGGTIYEVDL